MQQSPLKRISWLGSIRAVGFLGSKAARLDLDASMWLLARGLKGTRRRQAVEARTADLLEAFALSTSSDDPPLPGDASGVLERLVQCPRWESSSVSGPVEVLAMFCASPDLMALVGRWLTDEDGSRLLATASGEEQQLQFAFVDIELGADGAITEVAVSRSRGRRIQGAIALTGGFSTDRISGWLDDATVVAHNGDAHDFPILERTGVSVPTRRIDSLRWSWLAFPSAAGHSLADVCELLGGDMTIERHSAAADVELLERATFGLIRILAALPAGSRAGLLAALDGHVEPVVLTALLGDPSVRPVLEGMKDWERPGAFAKHSTRARMVHSVDLSAWQPEGATELVVAADPRRVTQPLPGRWAAGPRLVDWDAVASAPRGAGWWAAVAWRVCESSAGMLAFWPPSARSLIDRVPTCDGGIWTVGSGPWLTDVQSVTLEAPDRPVVLFDAVDLLLSGVGPRFDPADVDQPVTAVVTHGGPRRSEIERFWEMLLGFPVTFIGSNPRIDAVVHFVGGVPGGARPHVVMSRAAAVAATRSATVPTVLVTNSERCELVVDALRLPWRKRTGRSLLRPPEWPTVREAARRLREGSHLAVATPGVASAIVSDAVEVVVDRVGAPSSDNPIVRRLLESSNDPYADVIEPAATLRFLSLVTSMSGTVWVCDPVADSPLLRDALPRTQSFPIGPLEDTELGRFTAATILKAADPGSGSDPVAAVAWAVERILGPEGNAKPEQETVMRSVLDGHDVLAVFRTGMGKSLCYQAAGLAFAATGSGATLVVSPLIALQRDQVAGLRKRDVWQATFLNNEVEPMIRGARLRGIAAGFYTLVFVAPEGLRSDALRTAVLNTGLALVAVDEAHCISEMGHDFRPDYRTIPLAIRRLIGVADGISFADVPDRPRLMALTGTASPETRNDIIEQLDGSFRTHTDSKFVREELRFSVRPIEESTVAAVQPVPPTSHAATSRDAARWAALVDVVNGARLPGIVYVHTRDEAEGLARRLAQELGVPVDAYHAGLTREVRESVENGFRDGERDLLVATSAFGMGIDKDDIRLVVHWRMPGSPEALYQEAGRAGRGPAGQPADCVVLYHPEDLNRAARIRGLSIPSSTELAWLWATIEELHELQGASGTVVVADDDLGVLAGLRPKIDPGVALAHLQRVGLLRELERQPTSVRVSATGITIGYDLPEVERIVLATLPQAGTVTGISPSLVAEHAAAAGLSTTTRDVWRALRHLESVGAIHSEAPSIQVRSLVAEPSAVVRRGWTETKSVVSALIRHGNGDWHTVSPEQTGVPADRAVRSVEVLASLGYLRVVSRPNDGSRPRVRLATADLSPLTPIANAAPAIVAAASAAVDGTINVDDLAQRCGVTVSQARAALTSAHLFNAITLDQRRWEDPAGGSVCRLLQLPADVDPVQAIEEAAGEARRRSHGDDLRRQALHAYAQLESGSESLDAHTHQRFLEDYFTRADFLADLRASETDNLLHDLDGEQQAAVLAESSRLAIRAGAGTGKTRTITRRIAYRVTTGNLLPAEVVAVCFGKDAASEMNVRLASLGVVGARVSTLNALGWAIVRDYWPHLGRPSQPRIEMQLVPATQRIIRDLAIPDVDAGKVHAAIVLAKNRLQRPGDAIQDRAGLDVSTFNAIYEAYEMHLERENCIDFADQIRLAVRLLDNAAVGERVRSSIAEVYVDEAQDLSPAQWALVEALAADRTLTVVGDPRQAIFEWNGASPELFGHYVDEPRTATIDLVRNYRAFSNLVAEPNRLMNDYPPLVAARRGTGVDETGSAHSIEHHDQLVADAVQAWVDDGVPDDQIAVLTHSNEQVVRLVRVLKARSIPVTTIGLPPLHTTEAYRIARELIRGEYDPETNDFGSLMALLAQRDDVVDRILASAPTMQGDDSPWDDWNRLVGELVEYEREGVDNPTTALRKIADVSHRAHDSGVVVSTITKAKGLEWDAVVNANAHVIGFRNTPADRCLRYVALTRARSRRAVISVLV